MTTCNPRIGPLDHKSRALAARMCVTCLASCLLLVVPQAAAAADPPNTPDASLAREAMRDAATFPWYDAQQDVPKPIEVDAPKDLPGAPGWVAKPRPPQPKPARRNRWQWGAGPWGQFFFELLKYLAWALIAVLIGLAIYYWLRSITNAMSQTTGGDAVTHRSEAELIEQLPFRVKRPTTDLLAETRRCVEQSKFDEAIVYYYSYQLVQLDRHQHIELAKGKTNRQYLAELRGKSKLKQLLTTTILSFEDVFFGHYPLSQERFLESWNELESFQRQVAHAGRASDLQEVNG